MKKLWGLYKECAKHLRKEDTPAEVTDRWIIWNLKAKHISDTKKAAIATSEAEKLEEDITFLERMSDNRAKLKKLMQGLWSANSKLWSIEDRIRALDAKVFPLEQYGNMDCLPEHVEEYLLLARSVYLTNDERSRFKADINEMFGYTAEIKEYSKYEGKEDVK